MSRYLQLQKLFAINTTKTWHCNLCTLQILSDILPIIIPQSLGVSSRTGVSINNTYLRMSIYIYKCSARPTSRCRRTESIVSWERGVCSCAELQVFSCYTGWKEACQATRVISTTSRRELSSSFFFAARQGAEGNSRHSDRNIRGTYTIVCHRKKLGGPV